MGQNHHRSATTINCHETASIRPPSSLWIDGQVERTKRRIKDTKTANRTDVQCAIFCLPKLERALSRRKSRIAMAESRNQPFRSCAPNSASPRVSLV